MQLPSDNANLLTDATNHGQVFTGTTTLTLGYDAYSRPVANGWNCPSSDSSAPCTQITNLDLTSHPILYAANASGCTSTYDPTIVTYTKNSAGQYYGPCGDLYLSGSYTTSLTIAAANNVILTGDLRTDEDANGNPIGSAVMGLVANYYVRVKHSVPSSSSSCSTTGTPPVTIDAAILTPAHSFIVDNYSCGGTPQGSLTIHGAVAQYFRDPVGVTGSSPGGYLKNYYYDGRLQVSLPPYLFDLQHAAWKVYREMLCTPSASTSDPASCAYTGS